MIIVQVASANLLPPATKLGQGYIFTGVCYSVNRGVDCSQGVPGCGGVSGPGVSAPGGAWWKPPRRPLLRAVRILLEYIHVSSQNNLKANRCYNKCLK